MANTAVIDTIISLVQQYFVYMLPIIALLSGITFMVSFFMEALLGWGKRTFRG
jgi:hypothetical protein